MLYTALIALLVADALGSTAKIWCAGRRTDLGVPNGFSAFIRLCWILAVLYGVLTTY